MKRVLAICILFALTACTEFDDMADGVKNMGTSVKGAFTNFHLPKVQEPAPPATYTPTPAKLAEWTTPREDQMPRTAGAAPVAKSPAPADPHAPVALTTAAAPPITPSGTPHPFDLGEEDIPAGMAVGGAPGVQTEELPEPPPLPEAIPYKASHRPMIAIVIDDMGEDIKRSTWALDLPKAITMSYLPYAPKIQAQVNDAKKRGHEVILHMPMQADRASADPGLYHLSVAMTEDEIRKNTNAALDAFKGYDGLNNHMGSRFTSYGPGLKVFMSELEKRHIFFLDSKTAASSIAEAVARDYHIPTTHRDVFIDHVETADFVAAALNHAEDVARVTGSAIAIGHPKDVTLASIEVWMEEAKGRGFDIVPLATVMKYRNKVEDKAPAVIGHK